MKVIKCIILSGMIGFLIGLIIAICNVGVRCDGSMEGCSYFVKYGIDDGCEVPASCMENCFALIPGITCATFGCFEGCISCEGCISGCIEGFKDGYDDCGGDCSDPFYYCGECVEDCGECPKGCKKDVDYVYRDIKNNSKAKSYIIYFTIIGIVIGFVFGIVVTIQGVQTRNRFMEDTRQKIEQEAENNRKQLKEISEKKWEDLQSWLSE